MISSVHSTRQKFTQPRLMKRLQSEEGGDYSRGKTSLNEKMSRKRRPYFRRQWKRIDVIRTLTVASSHLLCLLAPFYFTWEALRLSLTLYPVVSLGITLSYHRNLAHRSFKLPKWLEYLFAYIGLFALQGHPIDWVSVHRFHHQFTDSDRDPHSPLEGLWFSHFIWIFDTEYIREKCGGRNNVGDLKQQWFYRFLQRTLGLHVLGLSITLYFWGGFPCVAWGMGVGITFGYHTTWLINSACHVWGSRAWKTNDTSRNVWWLSVSSFGESWHNNHHAFGSSARHGLEWWQIDLTWYVIRFLEAVRLATDVKLPTNSQIRRMALIH
ncbi:PREDICTED: delta-9 desaturase-like 3 protein [Tarenaya hassleriana]|uniref:delta-9 desaturase-like 3 protein n=1 Tax=Tarenaya hassleriana TaxID=28532 RepID=UPI00053C3B13|nr:PREDICTED: delta-9 desaturase-like 3 protein [Tarenaya hassleriana]